ncbi:hypothetical protein HK104_006509, partial [Borealophlyctis nickersoniae]
SAFLSALSLLHIPLTDRALRLFTCITDEKDDRWYISANPEVTCYNGQWALWRPFAFIFSLLYGAGIPITFFTVMFRNRKALDVKDVRRRLFFMIMPVLFRKHPTYLMFGSYIYLFAVIYIHPFNLVRNNHIAVLGWITTIIFLFAGIVLGFLRNEDDDTPIIFTTLLAFSTTLAIMLHGVLYEWEHNNRERWSRLPVVGWAMQTWVWHLAFPRSAGAGGEGGKSGRRDEGGSGTGAAWGGSAGVVTLSDDDVRGATSPGGFVLHRQGSRYKQLDDESEDTVEVAGTVRVGRESDPFGLV